MDTWHDVGEVFKLRIELRKKRGLRQNIPFIFLVFTWERKRKRMREPKSSFYDPRSSIGRNSSSKELKFIVSMRATLVYQKQGVSPKIKNFWA